MTVRFCNGPAARRINRLIDPQGHGRILNSNCRSILAWCDEHGASSFFRAKHICAATVRRVGTAHCRLTQARHFIF